MTPTRRIMALLAHPDDESLGFGGTLAKYAAEGHETYVVTATRGQSGRHRGDGPHPGREALGRTREAELRRAAETLGVTEVTVLDYMDAHLDEADPDAVVADLVDEIRRVRPDVVLTFAQDGAYGHPDHVAICQFATTAAVQAGSADYQGSDRPPHTVAKFYYLAWGPTRWAAYQEAFKQLTSTVDGVTRQAVAWPEWSITTRIDTLAYWPTVWEAVQCHETQLPGYASLAEVSEEHHAGLWGRQTFYRVFSTVNGGRAAETDLFDGFENEDHQ